MSDLLVTSALLHESPIIDDSPPPTAAKTGFQLTSLIGPVMVFVLFIGLWYFMHHWGLRNIFDKPPHLIPSPNEVIDKAFMNPVIRETLFSALGWTTYTALIGLAISIVIGMFMATLMSQARWLERSMWPYLVAIQATPILAVVPIIAVVFGYGVGSRILVCVIIAIFPIVSNTLFGLLSAETGQHDLFTLRGVGRITRIRKLLMPAAMPSIFNGFRIAAGLSVIGAVVGEQFFRRGGKKGLGMELVEFQSRTNYPAMYACLVLAALLGITVFVVFGRLSQLAVGRWYTATRSG